MPNVVITSTTNDRGDPNRPPTTTTVSSNLRWDEIKDAINEWLDPPDVATRLNLVRQARHKGTAEWFLHGSEFEQWKSSGTLFWIHGMRMFIFCLNGPRAERLPSLVAGAGKSTLWSVIPPSLLSG